MGKLKDDNVPTTGHEEATYPAKSDPTTPKNKERVPQFGDMFMDVFGETAEEDYSAINKIIRRWILDDVVDISTQYMQWTKIYNGIMEECEAAGYNREMVAILYGMARVKYM